MRKYKQVKEKKVTFDMQEWAEVERRAAACLTKTGTYIRHMAVHGQMIFYDMEKFVPVLNGMRIISNNIKWTEEQKAELEKLLGLADSVEYVSDRYYNGCMKARNARLAAMLLRLIQFLLNFELSYGLRRCS